MVKLYNYLSMGSTLNIVSNSELSTPCHYKYQSEFIVYIHWIEFGEAIHVSMPGVKELIYCS